MAVVPKSSGQVPSVKARLKSLRKVYESAQKRIDRQLQKAALTPFQEFRLGEHKKQIDAILTALTAEIDQVSSATVELAYKDGVDLTVTALKRQGMATGGIDLGNRLHTGAIQAVTDQMTMDLLEANGALGDHATRILRKVKASKLEESTVNEAISRGLAEGETLRETSKNLRKEIQKSVGGGAKVKVHCKDGTVRHYEPGYYAEMVAQTRTREATTQGNINGVIEYGITLFQVSFHEGACDYCVQFQGKVYSLDGKEGGFPKLEERPPYHPWCEHVLVPFVPEAKDEGEVDALRAASNNKDLEITSNAEYREIVQGGGKAEPAKAISLSGFNRVARKHGVETAGFANAAEVIRDLTATAITMARKAGLYVPEEIVAVPEIPGVARSRHVLVPAGFRDGRVLLDTSNEYWGDASIQARYAKTFGQWSTAKPTHPILHEFAHAEHEKYAREWFSATGYPEWEVLRDTVASKVSDRATDGIAEFVAEVRVGLVAGEEYPDDVLRWYTYFGGRR